jgi:hypothetical protein
MAGMAGVGGMTPQQVQQAAQGILQSAPPGAPWGAAMPQSQGPMGMLGGMPGGCPPWQPNCHDPARGAGGGGGGWGQGAMGRGARGGMLPPQALALGPGTLPSTRAPFDDTPWK